MSVEGYLSEIAERLESGHAAVMVGAGFSKNASPEFPDWNKLGIEFYKKLNGGKEPGKNNHFLNPMKLANVISALIGKEALNQFIKTLIPDKEHDPSEVHIELLKLPWVDIFTTNYDTLLERARQHVINQRFDVVTCDKELIYSQKPRIVKLHGCMDSAQDLIITDDDYREYPKKYAPFVNSVQQSLIENTLCLIGFSGDDPNFLNWLSWILYNLGKDAAPKIYLIGLFGMSAAERKLLEERNINVVDLSSVKELKEGAPETAIRFFIKTLSDYIENNDPKNWIVKEKPTIKYKITPSDLEEVLQIWKRQHQSYPNWIVPPTDKREKLYGHTEHWFNSFPIAKELKSPFDIHFLSEFNWRLEKSLFPIVNNWIPIYTEILNRYNPFPKQLLERGGRIPVENENINWTKIQKEWVELLMALLRYYREEGYEQEWEDLNKLIAGIEGELTSEHIARWYYERTLQAIFTFNIQLATKILEDWPSNDSLPFWEAKRAGILAELGMPDKAFLIADNALQQIRQKLNLMAIRNDYTYVSQEGYIMQIFRSINNYISFGKRNYSYDAISDELIKRWDKLKEYSCDPWEVINIFQARLQQKYIEPDNPQIHYQYDIGTRRRTTSLSRSNSEILTAYSFLRLREEAGIPFRIADMTIDNKTTGEAINRIAKHSPHWALVSMFRLAESDLASTLFNRESIYQFSNDYIDSKLEQYIRLLKEILQNLTSKKMHAKSGMFQGITKTLPEIISRLCSRSSSALKDDILDLLREVYQYEHRHEFNKIERLLERVIQSYSQEELYSRLDLFLTFPILKDQSQKYKDEFPDPFFFIHNFEKPVNFSKPKLNAQRIEYLTQLLIIGNRNERETAILRLNQLARLKLLTVDQENSFANNLWKKLDPQNGFPEHFPFRKFYIIHMPAPENISPLKILKKYLLNTPLLIQKEQKENSVSLFHLTRLPLLPDLYKSSNRFSFNEGINWTLKELSFFFDQLIHWWEVDKEYLRKKDDGLFGSVAKQFRMRFSYMVDIMGEVIIPHLASSIKEEQKNKLLQLINELEEYQQPSISLQVASLIILPERYNLVKEKLLDQSLSSKENEIRNAYEAIYVWLLFKKHGYTIEMPQNVISPLIQCINWRVPSGIVHALQVMGIILDDVSEQISSEEISECFPGLHKLIWDTDLANKKSIFKAAEEKLDVRRHAARLAYKLYRFYSDREESIPSVVEKWKVICHNEDEFSEIRNEWLT